MAMRKREDEVFPNAAGIDIGASSHWVAVPRHLAEAGGREPVRVERLDVRSAARRLMPGDMSIRASFLPHVRCRSSRARNANSTDESGNGPRC